MGGTGFILRRCVCFGRFKESYVGIRFTLCRCMSGIQSYKYVGLQANRGGLAGGWGQFPRNLQGISGSAIFLYINQ